MRLLIATVTTLALLVAAPAAQAAGGPYRTEAQAVNYLMKRIDSGTAYCAGEHRRPGSDRDRTFVCILEDWDAQTSTALRLTAKPRGRWHVRVLR